jgi:hypothetical protein
MTSSNEFSDAREALDKIIRLRPQPRNVFVIDNSRFSC